MSFFKAIAAFSAISCSALFQQAAAQYSVDLPYKQVSVENRNGKAVFNGVPLTGEPGRPSLPCDIVSILLPPEADFEDVTVRLANPVYEDLGETFDVDPPQYFDPPKWPDRTKIVDGKDTSVYRKDAFFPADFKDTVFFSKMWHYKVVRVAVYSYLYNPVRKKLRKLTGGVIEVSFQVNGNASSVKRMAWVEKELNKIVANRQILETYGTAPSAPPQIMRSGVAPLDATTYVIITTNGIYTGSRAKIDEYRQHLLNDDGYTDVKIITEGMSQTATTYLQGSGDVQERALNIREWIKAYRDPDDWKYLLLVGNPSPFTGDVPMKRIGSGDEIGGTDYFYGELDADWNGGTTSDLLELTVGRIPVYDDPATGNPNFSRLNAILQKTIKYKTETDVEPRRFALIPIVPAFTPGDDDFDLGDTKVKGKLDPAGWACRRLYEPYSFPPAHYTGFVPDVVNKEPLPEVPFCDYGRVVDNWNRYDPGLVVWFTHGWPQGASGIICSDPSSVGSLSNDYPSIIFSASCMTSHAQSPDNLGAEALYYNAVAYVGGTQSLYKDQIHVIVPMFVEDIRDNASVGDAVRAIYAFSGYNGSYLSEDKAVQLYGCPEVKINLPAKVPGPQTLSATWISNSQIDLSWTSVTDAQTYVIERGPESATRIEGWVELDRINGVPPATSYSDLTVTVDNKYKYRVWAITSASSSGYSPIDSVSTFSQSLLPQPPSNLQATADCYAATISWDPPATVQPWTYYNIKRKHVNSTTPCDFATVENTFEARAVFDSPAEDALLSGSANSNNNHQNYYGSGFVDGFYNSSTAAVEFTVDVALAGDYIVWLRHSAGSGPSSNVGLYVNGMKIKNITCPGTVNWDTWGFQVETVTLTAGSNTIKYKAETASVNCINLDHLYVRAVNSYIDNNLINGEEYEYTVSTVNRYGESPNCAAVVSATPQLRAVTVGPTFDCLKNITCNTFEYWWDNANETARLYNEIGYYYEQNIAGTIKPVEGTKKWSRFAVMNMFKDLDNNQTIYFRFRAGNEGDANVSSWSGWSSGTTDNGTPPGVPQNLTLTRITPTTVRLTYSPAPMGPQTDGYQLYHKSAPFNNPPDSGPFSFYQEVEGTVTSIDFSTSEGRIDSFTIRAYNKSACGKSYSSYSSKMYVYNGYWPVNSPYPLTALCVSPNRIDLTWPDKSAGEAGFRIERRENQGSWQFVADAAANATSYQDNSVTPGNVYEYRVRATCPAEWWPGFSDWASANASTKSPENIPEISFMNFTSPSSTQIIVNWWLDVDREWVNVIGYTLQQSSGNGSTPPGDGTYFTITTQPGNVAAFTVNGLTPGVNYWFRVSATTWAGTGAFKEQDKPVQTAPAGPTNLTAAVVSGSLVNLSWADNSSNEEEFILEYSGQDPPDWNNPTVYNFSDNVTTCSIDYFQPNRMYRFRIKASNDWGSSAYSNVVSATTPTDPCCNSQSNGNGLNGYVFGVAPPSAAGREYCKATDGNTATFYDYAQANGAYAGMRFMSSRTIRTIRFYPRTGYASRMVGGKFQGSNTLNFIGADDLHAITSTPAAGWNSVTISSTTPYEYVRYLAPNGSYGNIAEMEFYEVPTTYVIEATAEFGSISPSGSVSVNSHASRTFTIAPDPLFPFRKLNDVLVDNSSKGPVTTYTFSNVTGPHSIKAFFTPQIRYEAEDATLGGTAKTNTNHSGFSGTGFVDGFWNSANAQVSFTVYTGKFGDYAVKLRYSAGNGTSGNVGLYVNGTKVKNLTCPSTGNWDTWVTVSETVQLFGGFNTIQYKAENSSSYPINPDCIDLSDVSPRTINAWAGSNGSISPSGDVEVPYGGSQTFTIMPDPCYQIDAVWVDGASQGPITSFTFSNVTQDHTIGTSFVTRIKYEAENAILGGTAKTNTNHSGYSGAGFVDGFWNSSNATVLFSVNFDTDGSYAIRLRYSAGSGTSTNVGLYVDNVKIKNLACPGTANWDTWAVVSETVQLTCGVHQIACKAETSSGKPINLDYLSFDCLGQFVYEAEDAGIEGTAHTNSNHSGYSGAGFVDGYFESTTAATTFYVNVKFAGTYTVKLRYSAGNGPSANTGLYVNGVKVKSITCPGTGNWDTWADVSETVALNAASYPFVSNQIAYKAETSSGNCINLDKIILIPISIAPPSDLKAYMRDQTLGSNQQTQPRFYIQNEGAAPLSNFVMKYYFTVESGKTPVIENYYMTSYPGTLQHISGDDWCVVVNFPITLAAGGGRIPASDGLNFGLHYSDWSNVWNQANDFSQPAGSSYTLNNRVAIFNSSNELIYGSNP